MKKIASKDSKIAACTKLLQENNIEFMIDINNENNNNRSNNQQNNNNDNNNNNNDNLHFSVGVNVRRGNRGSTHGSSSMSSLSHQSWDGNSALVRNRDGNNTNNNSNSCVVRFHGNTLTRLRHLEDCPGLGCKQPESYAMVLHWHNSLNLESYNNVSRKKERWGNVLLTRFTRHMKNMEVIQHHAHNMASEFQDRLIYAAESLDSERDNFHPKKVSPTTPPTTEIMLVVL